MLYQRGRFTQRLNRLFITALFGSIIFVINAFLPPPINYILMVVQGVVLALSGLFVKQLGATYVGAVGGLLTALGSPALGSVHVSVLVPLRSVNRRVASPLSNQRNIGGSKP